jgi:hypothetical protein
MVSKTSFFTSSPHHRSLNIFSSPLFLNHMLFTYWIAAHSSAPPLSTIKSNLPPTACPI